MTDHPRIKKPTTDVDRFIATTARALADRHGIEAAYVATLRADAKLAGGDTEGARVWREVMREIERLQATPASGSRH